MAGSAELIKLVKRFPVLYDPADENYTDEAKRDDAWSKIAMLINSTNTEVERQWKVLEGNFRQCKIMDATNSWMWYEEMEFLDDYLPKAPKIEPESDRVETDTICSTTAVSDCKTSQNKPSIVRTSIVPGMGLSVQSRSVSNANRNSFNETENRSLEPAHETLDNNAPSDCGQYAFEEEVGNRSMIQEKELRDRSKIPSRLSKTSTQGRPGLRQPYGVTLAKNRKRPLRAATNGPPNKPDAIQLLFRSYTEQFKQLNQRLQGRLSVQIAQLFAAANNEQAQYEECLGIIHKSQPISKIGKKNPDK